MINRGIIFTALLSKISATPGIVTCGRKLKLWADVPPTQQPAAFIRRVRDIPEQKRGVPAKWRLYREIYLYVHDTVNAPGDKLDDLLDSIVNVTLASDHPSKDSVCTLGGLVEHCWVFGEIQIDDGALDNQAVAIIPIEILIT
jgi:hypothetical protein